MIVVVVVVVVVVVSSSSHCEEAVASSSLISLCAVSPLFLPLSALSPSFAGGGVVMSDDLIEIILSVT